MQSRLWLAGPIVVFAFVIISIVPKVALPDGGHDLHPYWYQGHVLRQGGDPYAAFLANRPPALPVYHLDTGLQTAGPLAQPGMSQSIPDLAPLSLALFSFSFLSWPLAKWSWVLANLGLMVAIPALVLAAFPYRGTLGRSDRMLVYVIFFGMVSTRGAIIAGQSSLAVQAALLAALLWRRRHPLLAGFLLGVALSKYSLALPLALFLVAELEWRNLLVLAIALLTQVAGAGAVGVLGRDGLPAVIGNYVAVFRHMVETHSQAGVSLAIWFPGRPEWASAAMLGLTALAGAVMFYGWWTRDRLPAALQPLASWHLLVLLTCWTFLAVYHGGYDLSLLIVAAPAAIHALRHPAAYGLGPRGVAISLGLLLLCLGVFVLPNSVAGALLGISGDDAMGLLALAFVAALLALFLLTTWYLRRLAAAAPVVERQAQPAL